MTILLQVQFDLFVHFRPACFDSHVTYEIEGVWKFESQTLQRNAYCTVVGLGGPG